MNTESKEQGGRVATAVEQTDLENLFIRIGLDPKAEIKLKDARVFKDYSSPKEEKKDICIQYFIDIMAGDFQSIRELPSVFGSKQLKGDNLPLISGRDILYAMLYCCDPFLLRGILSKLYSLGYAVPMIIQNVDDTKLTFLSLSVGHFLLSTTYFDSDSNEEQFSPSDFATISAIRFGDLRFSKSEVLNKILALFPQNGDYYFFSQEPQKSSWSKGSLEFRCHISHRNQGIKKISPFVLLNLRGDGLDHPRQRRFCERVSDIVIAFLPAHFSKKCVRTVQEIPISSHVIVVTEDKTLKINRYFSAKNITNIQCKGLALDYVVKKIVDAIAQIMGISKQGKLTPLAMYLAACSDLGILMDTDKFQVLATQALKLSDFISTRNNEIHSFLNRSQNCTKEEIACLKNHCVCPEPQVSRAIEDFVTYSFCKNDTRPEFALLLDVFLNEKFCSELKKRMEKYKIQIKNMKHMFVNKTSGTLNSHDDSFDENDVDAYEGKYLEACFENSLLPRKFVQKVWQIIQCSSSNLPQAVTIEMCGKMVAELLLYGHSTDLINCYPSDAPISFATTVLTGIRNLLGDNAIVRVVSLFGGIETNGFALLNILFGSNFTEVETICNGGITMQLIPVDCDSRSSLGFDYLILLSVKPLSLAEITLQGYSKRRKLISSLVSSITDVLILDIDKESIEEERTIMFDIFIHSMLKDANSVLYKCCVLYRVADTNSYNVPELSAYTLQKLKESCSKIDENGITTLLEDYENNRFFYSKVCDMFESGFAFVKVLPGSDVTNVNFNEEYRNGVHDLKMTLLKILKESHIGERCIRKLADAVDIHASDSQRYSTSSDNSIKKWSHLSTGKVEEYFGKKMMIIQSGISEIVKEAKVEIGIASTDDMKEVLYSEVNKIDKYAREKCQELGKELFILGEMNKTFCEMCKELSLKSWAVLEKVVSQSKTSLSNAADFARKEGKILNIIRAERNNIWNVYEQRKHTNTSQMLSRKDLFAAFMEEHWHRIDERYSGISVTKVQERIHKLIAMELRKEKYGKEMLVMTTENVPSDCFVPFKSMSSIKDIKDLEKRFNNCDCDSENMLRECEKRIETIRSDFNNDAASFVHLLKYCVEYFRENVDPQTMFIFLCSKFVSCTYGCHGITAGNHPSRNYKRTYGTDAYEGQYDDIPPCAFRVNTIQVVLEMTKHEFNELNFAEIAKTLLSKNASNFEHVPFNLQTLQRLDRHLLRLLPKISSQNMNNILESVNDSKIYLLGVTLATRLYDVQEIIAKALQLIEHALINGKKSKQIKAVAMYHVSSWASEIISVKEWEKAKESNISYRIRELLPQFELEEKIICGESVERDLAQSVCNDIEKMLIRCVTNDLQSRLDQDYRDNCKVLVVKKYFIGTMLQSFCQEDDFFSFISFAESFVNCGRKWMLQFLAQRVNGIDDSQLQRLMNDIIKSRVQEAVSAVESATRFCHRKNMQNLHSCVDALRECFSETMKTKCFTFDFLQVHRPGDYCIDVALLLSVCNDLLKKLEKKLKRKIEIPKAGNLDATKRWLLSLPEDMFATLSNIVNGCVEQCPYCGNVCEFPIIEHKFHTTINHIPIGISGGVDEETSQLIILTCSPLVSKTKVFSPDTDAELNKLCSRLNTWKVCYPDFKLSDGDGEPSAFWKYIISRFNQEFANYYECLKGPVPSEWDLLSKEDAIKSVEVTYELKS